MTIARKAAWQRSERTAVYSICGSLRTVLPGLFLLFWFSFFLPVAVLAKTVNIGVLMVSDIRQASIDGLKDGLVGHGREEGIDFVYQIKNAEGDRKKLAELAKEILSAKPDAAVAGGGVEADALLVASAGTGIPVVFLSVASSVDRGIAASMTSSGNNFTGIDNNNTNLTAKRFWYIRKMLPDAKTVFCFNVPSIFPSRDSLAIARGSAREMGFELQVADVESEADIKRATAGLSRTDIDVILLLPVAPIEKALRSIIFPKAMAEKIPIFGIGVTSIEDGAFASYAGSRYANGQQAARLMHKILKGTAPKEIPVEKPEKLDFIINKDLVAKLGLKLPRRVWQMADQIVDIQF